MIVNNLKGWGLRVNKIWRDADYMSERDPVYFAVFTKGENEVLSLIDGTVKQIPYGAKPQTLYWYFAHLPVEGTAGVGDYFIREVTVSAENPAADEDGVVAEPGTVTPVPDKGQIILSGTQKGESSSAEFSYTVLYEEGAISSDSNVRVDTVTNDRPGFVLKKQDWNGGPLEGAVFTLSTGGTEIGTFTSDAEGMITIAFLSSGKDYVLKETNAPRGWQGPEEDITIHVDGEGGLTLEGPEGYCELTEAQGTTLASLIVKNRPYTFRAVKTDGDTNTPLKDAVFALHRQVTVGGVTAIALNPMQGYESLATGADGVIPDLDNTLPAGIYELREKTAPGGYELLGENIQFSVSPVGGIELLTKSDDVTLDVSGGEGGALDCVLSVRNYQRKSVSVWKTGLDHKALTGAEFALYKAEDYDDGTGAPKDGAVPMVTGAVNEQGILTLGDLLIGEYRLVETKAPDGYLSASSAVRIYVRAGEVASSQDSRSAEVVRNVEGNAWRQYWVEGRDDSVWQIRVWNNPGVTLPSTGSFGRLPILLAGAFITAVSTVWALAELRRRRCTAE